jgi:hypothetical protein
MEEWVFGGSYFSISDVLFPESSNIFIFWGHLETNNSELNLNHRFYSTPCPYLGMTCGISYFLYISSIDIMGDVSLKDISHVAFSRQGDFTSVSCSSKQKILQCVSPALHLIYFICLFLSSFSFLLLLVYINCARGFHCDTFIYACNVLGSSLPPSTLSYSYFPPFLWF